MKRLFAPVMAGMLAFTGSVNSQNLTVAITSPLNRANFDVCSEILITADARIQTGVIKEVVFYRNGTVIATDKTAPYEAKWANVPGGWYSLSAKAKDDASNEALSDTVLIRVGAVSDGDQCVNGEFNCSLSPWRLDQYENAKATIEIIPDLGIGGDPSGAHIAIQDVGNQTWGVQLMQPFKLRAGHTYEVYFTAQSEGRRTSRSRSRWITTPGRATSTGTSPLTRSRITDLTYSIARSTIPRSCSNSSSAGI